MPAALWPICPSIKSALQMFDGQLPAHADSEKLCLSTWIPPIPSRAFSRLADSRLRALLGRRTPDQVTISITEECPNRCAHCALPNSGNKLLPLSGYGQRHHRPDSGHGNHAGHIRWRGAGPLPGAAGAGGICGRSGHLHPLHLRGGLYGKARAPAEGGGALCRQRQPGQPHRDGA